MADSLCKFLDARCITTGSQFFATYFSAQKPFPFFPLVSLHNPTLVRRRGRRKSLHIAFCSTPTSPNLDVISTHEHSDGSLLFRFGDPSELAKEDELEEPLLGVEEVERDSEEEFSVVKVLDDDNEREVIVKKVERKERGQAVTVATDAGFSESVVISNGRSDFVEIETGLSETLLGDSADDIASISPERIQDESVAEIDIENAEHVEEICEKKDDSEASVPSPENSIPSLEVEEEMKGQSSDQSFEELDDDKSPLLGSTAAMPEYSDSVNTKEIEESEGEGSNQLTENYGGKDCHDDSTRLMENSATLSEIEAADNDIEIVQQTEQISENIDPIMEEPVESAPEGINLGNTETVVDEISPQNADIKNLSVEIVQQIEQVSENVDPIMEERGLSALDGINLGNTETIVDEISPENADIKHLSVEIDQPTEQVSENVDLIMEEPIESAPQGINLRNTETVVEEISPENADIKHLSVEIDQQTEQVSENVDLIMKDSIESAPQGINLRNTETVVEEISPENADIKNLSVEIVQQTEQVSENVDLIMEESIESAPQGINLRNTETVVDEISPENADIKNLSVEIVQQTEQVSENVDLIMEDPVESAPEGINLGNTETFVDEVSTENADIKHLSTDAEYQSTKVLSFENEDQSEQINLSVDTEDQASQDGTFKDNGETNVFEAIPLSPKLDAEPILDEEVDQNLISVSNEGESPLLPAETLPSLSLEEERKEDVENTETMVVSGHEVVEDKSSEVLDSSKEATTAAAELILSSGATLLQYPSKAFAGGHEAYFVACGKWLGVADGVGSWSLEGSDPGVYARELMQNSESIVSQCDKDLINDPKQVVNLSVSKTDSPGSSTILIAHFDGKALHVANIGDSGFIVVRNGSVYWKSSPMLHEFNLPIQIEKGDDPSQFLEEYKIELDEGDIIVTATDALFDNLYDQEIVSIVSRSLEADKSPQEIAEILATRVQEVGSSASGRSPFADAAQAAGYVGYTGGKRDDVVVVVSIVQKVIMSNEE
ncbi:hypothetical protein HAX54_035294 [Datura stramonium]|uniref:PPM-type phosphatase domain-containing protein n=1 Tax=Datura stramonium TaxID=4076 RepID=A0ABS8RMG5_DATST|nr:hypothetical protein [Datura stramonium]